ncbi:MAG: hypothetical protein ACI8WB_000822 [Phenylobacterium sp.]|jgi:hypothetical protein
MTHFRPSMIATMVASALTVGTIGAVNAAPLQNINIDSASLKALANSSSATTAGQAAINKKTVSGMKNTFDAKLNRTTFAWASAEHARPEMIMVAPQARNAFAGEHYLKALTGVSSVKTGTSNAVLNNVHDTKRGGIIARYSQQVNDIEVFNRDYNVMMDRDHNLVAGSGYFANVSAALKLQSADTVEASFGTQADAIVSAYSDMGGKGVQLTPKHSKNAYTSYNISNSDAAAKQAVGEPRAKRVYFEHKGKLVAAHYVEVEMAHADEASSDMFSYVIDAKSQKVLFKKNLVAHVGEYNYRTFADTAVPNRPWDGPMGNVSPADGPDQVDSKVVLAAPMVSLAHGPISTMDPWLPEGATETVGNNVAAYVDVLAPDGLSFGDYTADTTSTGTFDYQLDHSEVEYSMKNRKAAIVNLFYMNNYLHDEFYDHGFDEASGNGQNDNFERGGEDGDALNVEVQDYSGTNNANMSTPADGASPRMQMFLWAQGGGTDVYSTSINGEVLAETGSAGFGPQVYNFTGNLARMVDGDDEGGTFLDGCNPAVNPDDIAGKVALVDRGLCDFTTKVMNAQDAGAIGVLVANNREGDTVITMGGENPAVVIGAQMVTENTGADLDVLLAAGDVEVTMINTGDVKQRASSWDNAIVAHEWGHYISNRLVGNAAGLSNNQGGAMGEGWGDFHALLTTSSADEAAIDGNDMFQKAYAGITYVRSFYFGIRTYPYTTDMTVNQHTFNSITDNPAVHASGNVWATFLWDSYVGLINDERHTFDEARGRMMDYVVAGYKMTPNAPTYVEARDAILAAAYAADMADYDIILAAFARRGLGLGAIAPPRDSTDHTGVVESYAVTNTALQLSSHSIDTNYEGLTSGYCSNDGVLDKGETGTATFTVSNRGSDAFAGVTGMVEVVSGHDVSFPNGATVNFGDLGVTATSTADPIAFVLNDADVIDELVLKVTFPDLADASNGQEYMISTLVNYDFKDIPLVGHNASSGAESLAINNDFKEHVMLGGEQAKGTGGYSTAYGDFWRELGVEMGDGSLHITNNGFASDVAYETKPIIIGLGGGFQMNFIHYYDFEADYDGGVIEISINGEEWVDIHNGGGQFLGDGYNGELIGNPSQPLGAVAAFTGVGAAFEAVRFSDQLNGQTVRIRFRVGTDGGVGSEGWVIDDLGFSNVDTGMFSEVVPGDTNACENRLPWASAGDDQAVNEGDAVTVTAAGVDANGDDLTYAWTQVSGPEVALTGADTMSATFEAPGVETDGDSVVLMVMVSDGTGSVSAQTTVTVADVPVVVVPPTPPVVQSRSSGSGSTGFIALLLLPLAFMRRRFKK